MPVLKRVASEPNLTASHPAKITGVINRKCTQSAETTRAIIQRYSSLQQWVPPAEERLLASSRATKGPFPFCVALRSLEGVAVGSVERVAPGAADEDRDRKTRKSDDVKTEYKLKLSLFDATYKQFFGRTWTSPVVSSKTDGTKVKLNVNQNVYFHTSLTDKNIFLVVEVVAVRHAAGGKTEQRSRGWGLFRIFQYEGKGQMLDTSSNSLPPNQKLTIYAGSPFGLCYLDDPIEGNSMLTTVAGCTVSYNIRTHHYLLKACHLIPENVIVGSGDVIPGLLDTPRDPNTLGAGADPLRKPRKLKALPCYIEKINVMLGMTLEKLEDDLCRLLNEDRLARIGKESDGMTMAILKRQLTVGVHNGWTYVSDPEVVNLALATEGGGTLKRTASLKRGHQRSPSSSSIGTANSLVHKNRVELEGMVEDTTFTVVFTLVYEFGERTAGIKDRSKTSVTLQSFPVTIRWGAWCPLANLNSADHTVQLIGGPGPNPDSVFVIHGQSAESIGSSASLSSLAGGTVSFSFHGEKKDKDGAVSMGDAVHMLQVPGTGATPRPMSRGSIHTEDSSVLMEASGRPPLPGSRPGTAVSQQQMISMHPPDAHGLVPPLGSFRGSPPQTGYLGSGAYPLGPGLTPYAGGMMGATPRGYMPVEISHIRDDGMWGSWAPHTARTTDLHELPFTPCHVPILATIPGMHNVQGLSRAAYARLYTAGFPPILDRKGEPPEVVDPADHLNFIAAKEDADVLKTNEIILQFLAFAKLAPLDPAVRQPSTVFFTFQFYRFPQVTSERLLLGDVEGQLAVDRHVMPCVLKRLDKDGSILKGPPGYQVKYHVDPAYLKAGEGRLFSQHMTQQVLHIDVWDGDSLHLIGSAAVELKHLCRQGRESVQVSYELDIIATEYIEHEGHVTSGDYTRDGCVRPVEVNQPLKGKLHVRMANVGHPAENKAGLTASMVSKKPKTVIAGETGTSFLGGSLNSLNSHVRTLASARLCQAQHAADTSQELAQVLFSKHRNQADADSENNATNGGSAKNKRKLARMEALRRQMAVDTPLTTKTIRQEKEERARDLQTINLYRNHGKREGILNMLHQAISTEHTINPSMGTTEFFEFTLKNPYNVQHTITVECDDQELSVITDPREWRHFKMLHEVYTSVEEGMFNTESKSGRPEIFLRPKETVSVPFKFLSFRTDQTVHPQAPSDPYKPKSPRSALIPTKGKDDPMSTRLVKVYFKTGEGKPISVLALRVEPQPHVVDQTFRFHHPEQAFLKKSIRLPTLQALPGVPVGGGVNQVYVRCSDPNIITECKKVPQGEPHDIFLKVACGAAPQTKRFFVALYMDLHMSKPLQIWQFYVHAMQRVDVGCTEGQTTRLTLILRGTQASRLVRCFSSNESELQVDPREPFMLPAGALQEVNIGVRPLQAGSKFLFLHAVDVESHQLVRSWLVCVASHGAVFSKVYELQLPVGGGKGSNKRISYTNPYPTPKVFLLRTNRDDLVQFKDTRLELGAGEKVNVGLKFTPSATPGAAEIIVFINDEDDKTEETLCVRAIYQ